MVIKQNNIRYTRESSSRVIKQMADSKVLKTALSVYKIINRFWYIPFLIIVPLILHLAYSRFGLNPSDDGFVLAYSRRILQGEIPHRDFISIRPVGSALIHALYLGFTGSHSIYLSRLFFWFELCLISITGIIVAEKLLKIKFNLLLKSSLAIMALFFCAHTFPPMAWHTVDGIFVYCLGLLLVLKRFKATDYIGYFLIGFSCLCKQNFLPIALATPFILGDWKRWKVWLLVFVPGIIYLLIGLVFGGLSDYLDQLTTQSGLKQTGLLTYQSNLSFLQKIPLGLFLSFLIFLPKQRGFSKITLMGFLLGGILVIFEVKKILLAIPSGVYLTLGSFQAAGLFLGAFFYFLITYKSNKEFIKLTLLFGLLAWCAGISLGYNNPALISGVLVSLLVVEIIYVYNDIFFSFSSRIFLEGSLTLSIIWLAWFGHSYFDSARLNLIYRQLPSDRLIYPLDDVLPGGKGILTDQNTFLYFSDLKKITDQMAGQRYAILPETAIYWAKAKEVNPLPIDWPYTVELNAREEKRLESSVDSFLGQGGNIIIQKYNVDLISKVLLPLNLQDINYPILGHVVLNSHQVEETDYFVIYKK